MMGIRKMERENLILTPAPPVYYSPHEKEKEPEQMIFPFMDETPPSKTFDFIMEEKENGI